MGQTIFKMFLISSVPGLIGKHVFVRRPLTWSRAQKYCREYYTDLSPIGSERDEDRLRSAATGAWLRGWIGLYREFNNIDGWKWSGGVNATYQNWIDGEPNNYDAETSAIFRTYGWNDVNPEILVHFFCLNLIVVREEKTWEEALEHCREHHTELTSLVSETEVLLAQREIQETQTTDRVWIGLSYLGNRWLWVNGDPLEYEAWTQGGDQHMCPRWSHSCGALTKEGLWENHYCQEKLNFICY